MKLENSEITTLPRAQYSQTGTQVGAHGSAMPAVTSPQDRQAALAMAVEQLTLSLRSPLVTQQDRDEMQARAAQLSIPARPEWIAARVASLLSPYYEKNTPQAVREMEADDWVTCLSRYPRWAVDAAVRWWKGPDNASRHKRPFEGDIAARVQIEMAVVRAANIKINAFDTRGPQVVKPPEPDRQPITPEELMRRAAVSAEIMGRLSAAMSTKPMGATE